jgi:beta-galactosidase
MSLILLGIMRLSGTTAYAVRLHFAELTFGGSGERVFNVAINGSRVLSNFDIYATSGAENRAITEQFNAVANSAGQIVIAFTAGSADNPEVNGIEVLQ